MKFIEKISIGNKYAAAFRIADQKVKGEKKKPSIKKLMMSSIPQMGVGIGTSCYFALLKYMALIFLFLSLFSLATSVLYMFQYPHAITFMNFPIVFSPGNVLRAFYENELNFTLWLCTLIPEIIFIVAFFFLLFSLRKLIEKVKVEADNGFLSVGDYSILVEGIPSSVKSAETVSYNLLCAL
ncbi:uncharacterized protein MONOS_6844 [Monocercomonoides exilis]|uniref:uncharacterized protein n=1 Tax=Monocercomonoides exilis TaxID=2049356 RepID=UPI00355A5E26|nr:hypothetical protein MONOS_6844 [Monocercomonoides exilis]|eukprot:MONOS_6844.1-p1 / transcript=MONOS_6844.1 / gene=MONOS_6844 / organism=Monocercomonoides_exilis_PA203 / gene_product=unspecified product / transcript_product=unspecified product / location=Mono_scaffold00223:67253-68036(-) / protein_length=182 / sequence_SO=supercontig / SO=protein_coding / is_pseudo=false